MNLILPPKKYLRAYSKSSDAVVTGYHCLSYDTCSLTPESHGLSWFYPLKTARRDLLSVILRVLLNYLNMTSYIQNYCNCTQSSPILPKWN